MEKPGNGSAAWISEVAGGESASGLDKLSSLHVNPLDICFSAADQLDGRDPNGYVNRRFCRHCISFAVAAIPTTMYVQTSWTGGTPTATWAACGPLQASTTRCAFLG